MANPAPDPNFTGAQKDAYAKQYGGYWNGSQYNATGTAPVAAAPIPKPAPIVAAPVANTSTAAAGTGTTATQTTNTGSIIPQGVGTTSTTPTTAGGNTIQTTFRDQLIKLMNTDPNSIKLTDPDLQPQAQAYADSQQRARETLQRTLAEQGFAGGSLGTGAYDREGANAITQQGENVGKFDADLITQAKDQRMQTLMGALGLGGQTTTSDAGLRVQNALGQSDINLRGELGKDQLGLGLLNALLNDRNNMTGLSLNAMLAAAGINTGAAKTLSGG